METETVQSVVVHPANGWVRDDLEHVRYPRHLPEMQLELDHNRVFVMQAVLAARGLVSRADWEIG